MSTEAGNEVNVSARSLRPPQLPTYETLGNRWAVIVGISRYKHERLSLQYAHRDAEELYELLQKPSGGGFEAGRIRKLVNEEATTAAVASALRSFLKQPAREDLVLIYFACHGAPDPDRPKNLYLITHDTDPDDIAGSALPMREIYQTLNETLLAERVVVIADTCHSAALSGVGRRGIGNDAQVINAYLKEASKAKGGVALLTSAEASEISQEGPQWGGGHGVFTHFLLQGMRGDADGYTSPKDGKITARELFEYVRDNVIKATKNKQHPAIGNYSFDPNLPMAITGGIDAQTHFELGQGLYELGCWLDDVGRFRSAAAQFSEAIQLARITGEDFPEAELWLAKALEGVGETEKAINVLAGLLDRGAGAVKSEALLNLGIDYANCGDTSAAIARLEEFLGQAPQDENAAWVRAYVEWLKSSASGRRYALLIGINQYRYFPAEMQLQGCVNDAELMKEALTKRCGFAAADVFTLLDHDATRAGILEALAELGRKTTPADVVVVHYSGHSVSESHPEIFGAKPGETYLIVHNTRKKSGYLQQGVSPAELHGALKAIPAGRKSLILDTHPYTRFNTLVEEDSDYSLLLASDSAELTMEIQIEPGLRAGAFTWALSKYLSAADPETMTCGQLIDAALVGMPAFERKQTPLLIGDREQLVFGQKEIYLRHFKFAQRRNYEAYTPADLKSRYHDFKSFVAIPFSQAYYSFGRAFLEKEDYSAAIEPLQTALQQCGSDEAAKILALGKAQISARLYEDAILSFLRYAELAPVELASVARELLERAQWLVTGQSHALLVGINQYLNPEVKSVPGALDDAKALQDILVNKLGFKAENIRVLLDDEATNDAIMAEFKRLVELARNEPALFFFAGNGSIEVDGAPTLVSADGRQEGVFDIPIRELAALARSATNLVTILDAGYQKPGLRYLPADQRERPIALGPILPAVEPELDHNCLRIGGLTIYNTYAIKDTEPARHLIPEFDTERIVMPPLTTTFSWLLINALVRALEDADRQQLTYNKWLELASGSHSVAEVFVTFGDRLDDPIFDNRAMRAETLSLLTQIEQERVERTITILSRMIKQRDQQNDTYPEGRLNLGIAYAAKGDYKSSIPLLERAVALYTDATIMALERERDPYAEVHYHDSHYQLGRVLFASGRNFTRAISELEVAIHLEPENVRGYYYLGQSIREMVEHETLARAKEALKTYLSKGAPLGHEDDVRGFLGSRGKNKPPVARNEERIRNKLNETKQTKSL